MHLIQSEVVIGIVHRYEVRRLLAVCYDGKPEF